jgi:hypothetical protein
VSLGIGGPILEAVLEAGWKQNSEKPGKLDTST